MLSSLSICLRDHCSKQWKKWFHLLCPFPISPSSWPSLSYLIYHTGYTPRGKGILLIFTGRVAKAQVLVLLLSRHCPWKTFLQKTVQLCKLRGHEREKAPTFKDQWPEGQEDPWQAREPQSDWLRSPSGLPLLFLFWQSLCLFRSRLSLWDSQEAVPEWGLHGTGDCLAGWKSPAGLTMCS